MGATSEHDDVESSVDRSEQQQSLLTIGLPVIRRDEVFGVIERA